MNADFRSRLATRLTVRVDGSGHVDIGAFQRQANDDEIYCGGFN